MPIRLQKAHKPTKRNLITPEDNILSSQFLQLPGEVRNMIYKQSVFPKLDSINISFGNARNKRHFARSVLRHPLFRTSHQVRNEALSYLCASKRLKILGIDAATAFFDCIGDAIRHMKALTLAQPIIIGRPLIPDVYELLFYFLDQTTQLKNFAFEVGRVGYPYEYEKENIGKDWTFLEMVRDFAKERKEIEFVWRAGAYEPEAMRYGHRSSRNQGILELFEGKNEDADIRDGFGTIMLMY